MTAGRGDFELTPHELRVVVRFVAEAAQDVLPLFERAQPDDLRPRAAVDAAWTFVHGAPRTMVQRVSARDAHRAAKSAPTEVSRLAAQAAGDAAAAAYLHPIAQAHQVGHILRASANAARIAELVAGDDRRAGREFLERERHRATSDLIGVLRRYPPLTRGRSRSAQLMADLDSSLRHALPTTPRSEASAVGVTTAAVSQADPLAGVGRPTSTDARLD